MLFLHDIAFKLGLLPPLRRAWDYPSNRRRMAKASKMVPNILSFIAPLAGIPAPVSWRVQRLVPTVSDLTVITLGPMDQPPAAVLKLPRSDSAMATLRRQRAVLAALHADPRLGRWRALLPVILAEGVIAGQPYLVEQMLPGLESRRLIANPTSRTKTQAVAAATIGELHRWTATSSTTDAGMLKRWIDEPLCLIRRSRATRPVEAGNAQALKRLAAELHSALAGRTLAVSWVHGDFFPGNFLMTPDAATVTGIVDWELAAHDDLPLLDLVQLFLSTRMLVQRRGLGDTVRELLEGTGWTAHEHALLDAAQAALPGDTIDMRTMVLLCWLRHLAANLTKSTRYIGHDLWMRQNIDPVLRCV